MSEETENEAEDTEATESEEAVAAEADAGEDDMAAAMAEEAAAEEDTPQAAGEAAETGVDLEELSGASASASDELQGDDQTARSASDLEPVYEVPVNVQAVLGKAHLEVSQLLKLGPGAIVELDRKVGEAIDIYVNDRLVARGEVILVEDHLGVTMTEIIKRNNA